MNVIALLYTHIQLYTHTYIYIYIRSRSLCGWLLIYIYIYICWNNQPVMNDFNKRTNTLLYKNISHTLFCKGWCFLCVRGEWETRTDCCFDQSSSRDYSSTCFSSWLGLLNRGSLTAQALYLELFLTPLASCLQLSQTVGALVILLFTSTSFCCSSAYLHRCISWLTARSRVNI